MGKQSLACVVLWLQNPAGKVLNISRKDNQSKFGLIGGKVDDIDFDIRSALNREVLEETGVDISTAPHRDMVTFEENGVPVHCFILGEEHCHLFPSAVYQNAEGTYVNWSQLYHVLGRDYCDFYEYNNKVYQYLFRDFKVADHLSLGNQHLFDFITRHLLTQKARAVNPHWFKTSNKCAYRVPDSTLKCAAGCLIHDDEYSEEFEGQGFIALTSSILQDVQIQAWSAGIDLVRELQKLHDCYITHINDWPRLLRAIARDYDLEYTVLSEYTHFVDVT